jgi:choline dehydrogenase
MNLILKTTILLLHLKAIFALPSPYHKPEKRSPTHLFGSSFGVPGNISFDYVIVGGGNAGLTPAVRLSKLHTVAVIEAGNFYEIGNGNLNQIPADDARFTGKDPYDTNPLIDWGFQTTPQTVITSHIFI